MLAFVKTQGFQILTTVMLLLLFVVPASATNYYVAPNGDDGRSGTSIEQAWGSYDLAARVATAGDTVFIQGGYWRGGQLVVGDSTGQAADSAFQYTGGGSLTNTTLCDVTGSLNSGFQFRNYGLPGLPIVAKGYQSIPIIRGNPSSANPINPVTLDTDYLVFDSLEVKYGYHGGFVGDGSYITVQNCIIDSNATNTGCSNAGGYYTIQHGPNNITIRNNLFFDNCYTRSNFYYMNSNQIHIFGGDSIYIVGNEFHGGPGSAIRIKGVSPGNKVFHIDSNTIWGYDVNPGINLSAQNGFDSVMVRWNIIYDCNIGIGLGIDGEASNRGLYVYNNTIDCGITGAGFIARGLASIERIQIFNNIIYEPLNDGYYGNGIAFKNETYAPVDLYEDHNLFYRSDAGTSWPFYSWSRVDMTLDAWRSSTGNGANSEIGDPYFWDAAARDYRPDACSPASSGGRGGIYPLYRGAINPNAGPKAAPEAGHIICGSSVRVTAIQDSSVVISWVTNNPSTSQVEYGTTSAYGSSTTTDQNMTTTHEVTLTGLDNGSAYHFRVRSTDALSDEVISQDYEFSTLDLLPPADVGGGITSQGDNYGEIKLRWSASGDDGTSGIVDHYLVAYDPEPISASIFPVIPTLTEFRPPGSPGAGDEINMTLTGLEKGMEYYVAVAAVDDEGNRSAVTLMGKEFAAGIATPINLNTNLFAEESKATASCNAVASYYTDLEYEFALAFDSQMTNYTSFFEPAPLASSTVGPVDFPALKNAETHYWRCRAVSPSGADASDWSTVVGFNLSTGLITGGEQTSAGNGVIAYPNPVSFARGETVKIVFPDIECNIVIWSISHQPVQEAFGVRQLWEWDGTNLSGEVVQPDKYIYVIECDRFTEQGTIVVQ
jgi:hypothetical protein